jgi:FtsZ-binding cell division protein ZapB
LKRKEKRYNELNNSIEKMEKWLKEKEKDIVSKLSFIEHRNNSLERREEELRKREEKYESDMRTLLSAKESIDVKSIT